MKRHVTSLLVATLCAVFAWACEQQSPTSPSALGSTPGAVSLGAAGGVSIGPDGLPIRTAKGGNKGGGGGGKGGGGKASPPIATLTEAMTSTGEIRLTFFKEDDSGISSNTDGKSTVDVTKAFSMTKTSGSCALDHPDPLGRMQGALDELDEGPQEIFALGISVDKTAMKGGVGLH